MTKKNNSKKNFYEYKVTRFSLFNKLNPVILVIFFETLFYNNQISRREKLTIIRYFTLPLAKTERCFPKGRG